MLRLIEFPLAFIRLDELKIGIFAMFWELFLTLVVLVLVHLKTCKNNLRTTEAEIS